MVKMGIMTNGNGNKKRAGCPALLPKHNYHETKGSDYMVKETKKIVKFDDLGLRAKMNCVDQFLNVICPYEADEDYSAIRAWKEHFEGVRENIDLFVEATPDQFYFDENGDWYDEGRKVKS